MGIWSAAKLYALEFLPICTEQYDLLIPDSAWDTPMVQKLIALLRSEEFQRRLESLGDIPLIAPVRCGSGWKCGTTGTFAWAIPITIWIRRAGLFVTLKKALEARPVTRTPWN